MGILESTGKYEDWLRKQLGDEVVEPDLVEKHERMSDGAFTFLRATYWRWADKILDICSDLASAPKVLAVGDIHVENYGTWRDNEGRLVWGVNDFDEAAVMPYALDLVRLATSAVLRPKSTTSFDKTCGVILDGYREGIDNPRAAVLDRDMPWLQGYLEAAKDTRQKFWEKFDPNGTEAKAGKDRTPPLGFVDALKSAMGDSLEQTFWARQAGGGSLGRPRWVGHGVWHGAPIVREAKAMVPSGWVRAGRRGAMRIRCLEVATGRYRSPDPWLSMRDTILVRRLSPTNSKLEIDSHGKRTPQQDEKAAGEVTGDILRLMGSDLAGVHLGTGNNRKAIKSDLRDRGKIDWFTGAVAAARELIESEQGKWEKAYPKKPSSKKEGGKKADKGERTGDKGGRHRRS